jgi:tetratricopeptide (TPR) repeat protein
MSTFRRWFVCLCVAAAALLAAEHHAVADTIHLTNGGRLEGRIVERADDRIYVQVSTARGPSIIGVRRNRILRIDEGPNFDADLAAAQAKLEAGETADAEIEFRALVRREPANGPARIGLARALSANFKYVEALKILENYLELVAEEDRDPNVLLALAEQYMYAREFRLARRVARDAGALAGEDEELKERAEILERTIERYRTGQQQSRERQAAHEEVVKERRKERAEWDEEVGNNREAQDTAEKLSAWVTETHPTLVSGVYLSINAPDDVARAYMAGEDVSELRERVNRAEFKVIVDEALWTSLYDRHKAQLVNGWYFQLNDLYPRSNPRVMVYVKTTERGREVEKMVARGAYDGRRRAVLVERWTERNPDPSRPARNVDQR